MIYTINHFLKQFLPKLSWTKVIAHKASTDGPEAFIARVKMNSNRLR
jgi:hypothetical protein